MPDHDVMGEFFEDEGLAWEGTVFGVSYVGTVTRYKRKEWTREDAENYDLSCLASEYLKEWKKGLNDE